MHRRIYLMRHGEAGYLNADGSPRRADLAELTAEGVAQARAAGNAFKGVPFDRVITSGLPRTVRTAEIVLSELEDPPAIESYPELREIRGGRLREIPCEELEAEFLRTIRGPVTESARFLRGESIGELLDRVMPFLEGFVEDGSWRCTLMVLHGGVNRAIISYALLHGRGFLGNLAQSPGCINLIEVGSEWSVRMLNWSPLDPIHASGRRDTMEELLEQYQRYRSVEY